MNKRFYALLRKSKRNPLIINMSSQGGKYAFLFWGPYHMSKFALKAHSYSLRRELKLVGINVVVIQPGAIASQAFLKQKERLSDYEQEVDSEFTPYVVQFLKRAFYDEN